LFMPRDSHSSVSLSFFSPSRWPILSPVISPVRNVAATQKRKGPPDLPPKGPFRWCGTRDSNPELLPCKGSTLPVELIPPAGSAAKRRTLSIRCPDGGVNVPSGPGPWFRLAPRGRAAFQRAAAPRRWARTSNGLPGIGLYRTGASDPAGGDNLCVREGSGSTMHALWKGAVSFGLVHIPIKIYPATQRKDVSFNQLHQVCGSRIRHLRFCPHCQREAPPEEIVRGYEYDKRR